MALVTPTDAIMYLYSKMDYFLTVGILSFDLTVLVFRRWMIFDWGSWIN